MGPSMMVLAEWHPNAVLASKTIHKTFYSRASSHGRHCADALPEKSTISLSHSFQVLPERYNFLLEDFLVYWTRITSIPLWQFISVIIFEVSNTALPWWFLIRPLRDFPQSPTDLVANETRIVSQFVLSLFLTLCLLRLAPSRGAILEPSYPLLKVSKVYLSRPRIFKVTSSWLEHLSCKQGTIHVESKSKPPSSYCILSSRPQAFHSDSYPKQSKQVFWNGSGKQKQMSSALVFVTYP